MSEKKSLLIQLGPLLGIFAALVTILTYCNVKPPMPTPSPVVVTPPVNSSTPLVTPAENKQIVATPIVTPPVKQPVRPADILPHAHRLCRELPHVIQRFQDRYNQSIQDDSQFSGKVKTLFTSSSEPEVISDDEVKATIKMVQTGSVPTAAGSKDIKASLLLTWTFNRDMSGWRVTDQQVGDVEAYIDGEQVTDPAFLAQFRKFNGPQTGEVVLPN